MTKVLVTGASGFIGLNFLKLLRSKQINFFAPSSSEVNLCDFSQTHSLIRECNPEVIIHLASQGVKHSDAHNKECNTKNVGMFKNLLKSITPDNTLCVTGSMAEYGFSGTHKEVDKCFPTTQYGLSKLQITDLARSYRHSLNFDIRIFRLYGVYGYGERPERLFPSVIQALQNNVPVKLSDCEQERDFVHVDDVCRLLLELSKKKYKNRFDIVNIGTGKSVKVKNVCLALASAMNAPQDLLKFGQRCRSPGDADYLCADTSLLQSLVSNLPVQYLANPDSSVLRLFNK